jgi:hypothetical protein
VYCSHLVEDRVQRSAVVEDGGPCSAIIYLRLGFRAVQSSG